MGTGKSKKKETIIPVGYKKINIISINIDIKNSINLKKNICTSVNYILSNKFDIACFINIKDKISLYNFIEHIKKKSKEKNIILYFSPYYDIIINDSSFINTYTISEEDKNNSDSLNNYYPHLLISKYPIHSYTIDNLNNNRTTTLLCVNIIINGKIITIFLTSLSRDIESLKLSNKNNRSLEIIKIKKKINKTFNYLKNNFTKTTDIGILIGNLNINEFNINGLTNEFLTFIKTCRVVDLHRYKYPNDKLITNNNKRLLYILYILTDDLFNNKSEYNIELTNVTTPKDMFDIIFQRYNFYCLDINIDKNNLLSNNYPIKIEFIIKI